jgi:hypothetical protein
MSRDVPAAVGGHAPARPTRAELRRAREAALHGAAVPSSNAPPGVVAVAGPAVAAPLGRAELRRQRDREPSSGSRSARRGSLAATWWIWPLVAVAVVLVVLGVRNAAPSDLTTPPVVVTSGSPSP